MSDKLKYMDGYNDGYHGIRPKERWNEQYMEGWEEGEDDWWFEEEKAYSLWHTTPVK